MGNGRSHVDYPYNTTANGRGWPVGQGQGAQGATDRGSDGQNETRLTKTHVSIMHDSSSGPPTSGSQRHMPVDTGRFGSRQLDRRPDAALNGSASRLS